MFRSGSLRIMVEPGTYGIWMFVCGPEQMHLIPSLTQQTTPYVVRWGGRIQCKITWIEHYQRVTIAQFG